MAFSKCELDIKEKCWIKFYNSLDRNYGYNKRDGGNDGFQTTESKKNNSITKLGFDISKYTKDIIKMYVEDKMYISDISKKYKVGDSVINRILKENNIHKRSSSENMLGYDYHKYEKYVLNLYNNGCTKTEISNKLSISIKAIDNIIKENNLKPRTIKEVCELRKKKCGYENPASTSVYVYDKNMELINEFKTISDCSNWMVNNGISNNISSAKSAINRSIENNRFYKNKYYFKKVKNFKREQRLNERTSFNYEDVIV